MANLRPRRALEALDRVVGAIAGGAIWLVIPVSVLLFLQWPLRELLGTWSREANDLAQVLFALYVSVAVTAATRQGAHLAADALARRYRAATRRRLWRAACVVILVPWSLFVLYAGGWSTWLAIAGLERFPETLNPGYFVVRIAALVLAALVLVQAWIDALSGSDPRER